MKLTSRIYFAKLLLFGEYTVTQGGSALALPLQNFSGKWLLENYTEEYAKKLLEFTDYIEKLALPGFSALQRNVAKAQIASGLQFVSDIPSGYGLGSSGTFVAAFYDRFFQKVGEISLPELKSVLAVLETYFHGKSSGIDPLVSFLNTGILMEGKGVTIADLDIQKPDTFNLFLVDTGISRSTAYWVEKFYDKLKIDIDFVHAVQILEKINDQTIQAFMEGNFLMVKKNFNAISRIQYSAFNEYIPENYRDLWKKGLDLDVFDLKLCGAGGGGMLLGLTEDFERVKNNFPELKIHQI